ncbi:MAG: 50S ribosomal protein L13 [Patescibacteria group bacterium]|nr:50S ribosomal protein L13 [Patescibacteria group bacterium]
MQKSKSLKKSEIEREWHLIDAKDQVLGRMSTRIAKLLMGKDKVYYVPHLDCGDFVVLTNAEKVKVTGRKETQKLYQRHSGYPGGFKEITFEKQMAKDPEKIIVHAVGGMLPKNKLRNPRLKRLKIFIGEDHGFADKFKKEKPEK